MKILLRSLLTVALAGLALLATGCSTLPNFVSVEELSYQRTDPAGGTKIEAKGLRRDGDGLTAEEYSRETHYPSFNQSVKLKGAKFAKAQDVIK